MAVLKTKQNDLSVDAYVDAIDDPQRCDDCRALIAMMGRLTGAPPKMWGTGLVGFGAYHYRYASGHEGDAMRIGFASRKASLTLYLMPGLARYAALTQRLGKHKASGACLHLKRLADVDLAVLEELLVAALDDMQRLHGR